jgi:hypothetical protein
MAILNCFVSSVFTEHREDLFPQPRAAVLHKDFFAPPAHCVLCAVNPEGRICPDYA